MSEYLIKAILLLLYRQYANGTTGSTNKAEGSHAQLLKELIEKHYREHWTSDQYAHALGTSTSLKQTQQDEFQSKCARPDS
jgi:AraC family transcriptional regulator, transcriptional activator of pobA